MRLKSRVLLLGGATLLTVNIISITAQADTSLTYIETSSVPTRTTHIHIHGKTVRMEEANSSTYLLYDDSKPILYNINTRAQQYIINTPQTIRERAKKTAELQRQTQAALKQQLAMMPEEQRASVQANQQQTELQRQTPASNIRLEKTDKQDSVAKLACSITQLTVDGQVEREICNAAADAIPATDLQTLVHMFGYLDNMAAESAKAQGITPPAQGTAILHKAGLALRIQAITVGGYHSELNAWDTKTALDDALFSLPRDFHAFEPSVKNVTMQHPTH